MWSPISMKISTPPSSKTSGQFLQGNLLNLQNIIGIHFINTDLLKNAFIHRSYLNENKSFRGNSNERLEFLGDAILSAIVSQFLYQKLPKSQEGQLTQIRASLVRTETLSKIAKQLNLGQYLYLSKGEEDTGGRANNSILANTIEALIGAIFLDQGWKVCEKFINNYILKSWQKLSKTAVEDNKSKLQEVLQRKYRVSPTYKLLSSWGPDHSREFEIGVYQNGKLLGKGIGKNKQIAAQVAAKNALLKIRSAQRLNTAPEF